MVDPFDTMGIKSIEIVNEAKNCSAAQKCDDITDMISRWRTDTPEVVALFIPLGLNETGSQFT